MCAALDYERLDSLLKRQTDQDFLNPINSLILKELVRPGGFEPPTFCSGGSGSMCILLTSIAAMTSFKANRRRTKAAVDERLMKGFFQFTFLRLLSPRVGRGVRGPEDDPIWSIEHGPLAARGKSSVIH
jgi:hypothetical protein